MTRIIRSVGWTLIVLGVIMLLYVVYLLWFTNFETQREQRDLADEWSAIVSQQPQEIDDVPSPAPQQPSEPTEPEEEAGSSHAPPEIGDAYSALWFERDGERIINDEVLYVVEGVDLPTLRRGPGHYPESDRPGGAGNFAIAGHRTTYGAPLWSLNELEHGDTIHVMDREGREWVYRYVEQRIVHPAEMWVVGEDPLNTGAPTVTLTTCHPRYSAAQRLIAWGELIDDPIPSTAQDSDRDQIVAS